MPFYEFQGNNEAAQQKTAGGLLIFTPPFAVADIPSLKDLMIETGYGREAILDNIKYLKEFWEFPLKVSQKEGRIGYYYDGPTPEKIAFTFTEGAVINLALAQKAIETLPTKGDRLGLDMETIEQILVPHTKMLLDEVRQSVFFRPFAPEEVDLELFKTRAFAIRKRRSDTGSTAECGRDLRRSERGQCADRDRCCGKQQRRGKRTEHGVDRSDGVRRWFISGNAPPSGKPGGSFCFWGIAN